MGGEKVDSRRCPARKSAPDFVGHRGENYVRLERKVRFGRRELRAARIGRKRDGECGEKRTRNEVTSRTRRS